MTITAQLPLFLNANDTACLFFARHSRRKPVHTPQAIYNSILFTYILLRATPVPIPTPITANAPHVRLLERPVLRIKRPMQGRKPHRQTHPVLVRPPKAPITPTATYARARARARVTCCTLPSRLMPGAVNQVETPPQGYGRPPPWSSPLAPGIDNPQVN